MITHKEQALQKGLEVSKTNEQQPLAVSNNWRTEDKTECYIQNYNIVIVKCPVFNNNNKPEGVQRNKETGQFNETETGLEAYTQN